MFILVGTPPPVRFDHATEQQGSVNEEYLKRNILPETTIWEIWGGGGSNYNQVLLICVVS